MKYFVTSDIHSFFTEFKNELDKVGFDETNPEHKLIICGDIWDRGEESQQMYDYVRHLMEIDKVIYIFGNHEQLLLDLLDRGYYQGHDVHNHTVDTVYHLCGLEVNNTGRYVEPYSDRPFDELCEEVKPKVEFLKDLPKFYETEHYIFVHSWIPTTYVEDYSINFPYLGFYPKDKEYNPNWRNEEDWDDALWTNPFLMSSKGLNQTGKTIVFGHWHTPHYRQMKGLLGYHEEYKPEDFDPVFDTEWGIIGLDGCTVLSGKVNIIVLED